MSKLDKFMKFLAPLVLVSAAVLVISFLINQIQTVNEYNNVYVRYIACALSVDPEYRTQDIINKCWDHVIEESGHDVHRYDEKSGHPWLKRP